MIEVNNYLPQLYKEVTLAYRNFFPEIYTDVEIPRLIMDGPHKGNIGGKYNPKKGQITIRSGTFTTEEEINAFGCNTFRRGKIYDAVILAHEYTHAIYYSLKNSHAPKLMVKYAKTADHAINEGLAVLMELLFIDMLKQNPHFLQLSQQEVESLESCKKTRLYGLKHQQNAYTQGTYRILHKVYADGAGSINHRDMHQGLVAVRWFIDAINPAKTISILRRDHEYKALLKEGNPEGWKQLFS